MSRKRRNSFEALQVVDKKREEKENKEMKKSVVKNEVVKVENVEVVEMNKEVKEVVKVDNKEMVEMKNIEIFGDEMVKEFRKLKAKRDKLDVGIRNAIIKGKNETSMAKCITKGQLLAIVKNYRVITGFDMSDIQVEALKKLNGNQVYYIEQTISWCLRKISEHNYNKRMLAKAN